MHTGRRNYLLSVICNLRQDRDLLAWILMEEKNPVLIVDLASISRIDEEIKRLSIAVYND